MLDLNVKWIPWFVQPIFNSTPVVFGVQSQSPTFAPEFQEPHQWLEWDVGAKPLSFRGSKGRHLESGACWAYLHLCWEGASSLACWVGTQWGEEKWGWNLSFCGNFGMMLVCPELKSYYSWQKYAEVIGEDDWTWLFHTPFILGRTGGSAYFQ